VLNAFGMLHVANPHRASAEAYRVLKAGGRFAYASWHDPAKCVLFSMVFDAIRERGSLDVGLPAGPDSFSCGAMDYAVEMLGRAGFTNISASEIPLVWRVSSPDIILDAMSSATVRTAAVLKRQSRDALEAVRASLRASETAATPFPRLPV
jgi:SAM-dependent methyltransferase